MKLRKLRTHVAVASTLGAVALAATMVLGGGVASATVPPAPTAGVYPAWIPADFSVSHIIRSSGSDTTFPMMQVLGDLYTGAGLNGCTLNSTNTNCNTAANVDTTDTVDNYALTEILTGDNDIGSGNGQQQLCGYLNSPDTVDFSRSSKPIASSANCTNPAVLQQNGYAKDSVPVTDFQNINPAAVGTATGYIGQTFNGVPFPSTGIGAVAAGWLPGDPTNCVAAGTGAPACSGTAFSDIDGGTTSGTSSVPYRLWCQTTIGGANGRITDWGQLTNLSAANNGGVAQTVGNGAPIGVPIRIIGVNPGSGTVATWFSFANSGASSGPCTGKPYNPNAASGPNPLTADGDPASPVNHEIALENNASQIGQFAATNWPNDPADQAVDIATSLYFQSYGYYNTIPNSATAQLTPGTGTVPAGVPTAYTVSLLNENGIAPSILHERTNTYPTARTLFNIYRTDTVKAAFAGFENWLCGTNTDATGVVKGTDQVQGNNYDSEITTTINGTFGFSRLTDNQAELASGVTPPDGVSAPNSTCDAQLPVTENSTTTLTDASTVVTPFPAAIQPGWAVTGSGIPSGDTVASVTGTTLTLTTAATATGSVTVYFPGHPPVLAVAFPND